MTYHLMDELLSVRLFGFFKGNAEFNIENIGRRGRYEKKIDFFRYNIGDDDWHFTDIHFDSFCCKWFAGDNVDSSYKHKWSNFTD